MAGSGLDGERMEEKIEAVDYRILKRIAKTNKTGGKILSKDFRSNSLESHHVKILKDIKFIKKRGPNRGWGTLYLTQKGKTALKNIPEDISQKISIGDLRRKPKGIKVRLESISEISIRITGYSTAIDEKLYFDSAEYDEAMAIIHSALSGIRKGFSEMKRDGKG